ncbi:MAG: glycosyltransferase family 2 protein [Methylocystis sp.]|uniref:glycosyltransferase family 2 protein n=1 Tax=Methylocystis sp. TaxID=1911079 RepID=UPI003DA1D1BD
MLRHAPARPVTAFFRFFNAEGKCVVAFPFRLADRVTYFNEVMMDPALTVQVDCGEPDARISVRVRPCDWRYNCRREISYVLDRLLRKPSAPAPDPARIAAFEATGVATSSATPLVSIVIPTRDRAALLACAVETLFETSDWPLKELVIVDNGSVEPETFALFERLRGHPDVTILRQDEPFNFARLINAGARAARGEVLALVNNDVEARSPDWLSPLVRLAIDPRVGVVGAKLLYENGLVQHAGIVLGIRGLTGHAGSGRAADDPGPYAMLTTTRRVSAVTGACLLTRRQVFEELGGFNEDFVIEYNDVDYCLRAGAAGYAVVCAAAPALLHKEGSTRQARPLREQEVLDRSLFMQRWGHALINDPYYPPELTLRDESLDTEAARHAG